MWLIVLMNQGQDRTAIHLAGVFVAVLAVWPLLFALSLAAPVAFVSLFPAFLALFY